MLRKVISGGQTGADQIGIMVAKNVGFETGGWAPKGWKTEDGPAPWLADFGLREAFVSDYEQRTEWNVVDSDGTVLFGDMKSPGSKKTIRLLKDHKKPYIENPPTVEALVAFILDNDIAVLNVAGNRGSKLNVMTSETMAIVLLKAFTKLKK